MVNQIDRWRGDFGDAYTARSQFDDNYVRSMATELSKILIKLPLRPVSILEVGANVGTNLEAIRRISDATLTALEPNASERRVLDQKKIAHIDGSAQNIPLESGSFDLVFTAGVLIHISPDNLLAACKEIHRVASKYILTIEYFADQPEQTMYRGEEGLLFKRDFGAFWLDNLPDIDVIDYGFIWKRATKLDNMNWWLFRKRGQDRKS